MKKGEDLKIYNYLSNFQSMLFYTMGLFQDITIRRLPYDEDVMWKGEREEGIKE